MSDNNVTPIRKPKTFSSCSFIYVRLCFFLASPDQLPNNILCAIKAFILYCAVNIILLDVHSTPFQVIAKIGFEIAILAAIVFIGLKLTKKPERFTQTLSALIGSGMVISLISTPIYLLLTPEFQQNQEISQNVVNITLIVLVWNLAVISSIFKRSFEISTLGAAVVSFNYLLLFQMIIFSLFGNAS